MGKLTPKQKRFVDEYLIDLNATQAAIRAGYSKRTANEQGARLLANVSVQEAVQAAMAERGKRTQMEADEVLQRLAQIARRDIKDYVTWEEGGNIKLKDAAEVDGTLIDALEEEVMDFGDYQKISRKVKFPDRMKALELLGKHHGLFKDNVNVSGDVFVKFVDDVDD